MLINKEYKTYLLHKMELVCRVFKDREYFYNDEVIETINMFVDEKIYAKSQRLRSILKSLEAQYISDGMLDDVDFFISIIDKLIVRKPPLFNETFIKEWSDIKKEINNAA